MATTIPSIMAADILPLLEDGFDAAVIAIYIEDVEANAREFVDCLDDPTFADRASVKGIFRGALERRAGKGQVTKAESMGPFSESATYEQAPRARGGYKSLSNDEISRLQQLCRRHQETNRPRRQAFTIRPSL